MISYPLSECAPSPARHLEAYHVTVFLGSSRAGSGEPRPLEPASLPVPAVNLQPFNDWYMPGYAAPHASRIPEDTKEGSDSHHASRGAALGILPREHSIRPENNCRTQLP